MRRHALILAAVATVTGLSGCGQMPKSWSSAMPWSEKEPQITESKYQAPVKMAVLWTPAMYNAPGKKPIRGFGGRIYFYNSKNEPIPVDGQLVVYGYNDTSKAGDHKQADRRIAYTPEQFRGHFSPTELGASYSVWVPWDAVGNPQAEVTLLPIFTAATGQVVMGQQSIGLLPGAETPAPEKRVEETVIGAKVNADGSVTRVAYEEDLRNSPGLAENTFSVTLPQGLAERMAAASQYQERSLPPKAGELPSVQPQPLVPFVPQPGNTIPGVGNSTAKESPSAGSGPLFLPLAPLTRFEQTSPQAPASPRQQPALGPARTLPPLGALPPALPSSPESGRLP